MKLIIFCTYRTSPYSGGARKRVLTIEANTPTNTPNIVDRYNSTTCFLCLEKLRKICFTLPDAVYIANTPTFILDDFTAGSTNAFPLIRSELQSPLVPSH